MNTLTNNHFHFDGQNMTQHVRNDVTEKFILRIRIEILCSLGRRKLFQK